MTLGDLQRVTQAQAREFYALMQERGNIPPPPSLGALPAERLGESLEALREALTGQALAWGRIARPGAPTAFYAQGVLYTGAMLRAFVDLDPVPLHSLTTFTAWGASFLTDVLEEHGHTQEGALQVMQRLEDDPAALGEVLPTLPPHGRGALAAAYAAFHAGMIAVTCGPDPDPLHACFAVAGHTLDPSALDPQGPGLDA